MSSSFLLTSSIFQLFDFLTGWSGWFGHDQWVYRADGYHGMVRVYGVKG